jgi:ABC-type glycerol-3-phosphate transport system substrate-binding protein
MARGGGFLALLGMVATAAALASGASASAPARRSLPQRTGPFHWHVTWAGNTKYFFENIGRSHDGYAKMRCPFCHQEYVKRPRRR